MVPAAILGLFLAMLVGATASLTVRRANPGVGAVAGSIVLFFLALLLVTEIVGFLGGAIRAFPNASRTSGTDALLVLGAQVGFLLLAVGIGVWQARLVRMQRTIAILGSLAELFWIGVGGGFWIAGGETLGSSSSGELVRALVAAWIGGWIVAALIAPLIVHRLRRRRTLPIAPDAPHEWAAF